MKFNLSSINAQNIKKGINYIRYNGLKGVVSRVRYKMSGPGASYNGWYKEQHAADDGELARQRAEAFSYEPLISILVPVYKTPETFLRDLLDSVRNQTYGNWELCIADGSGWNSKDKTAAEEQEDDKRDSDGEPDVAETERIIRQYMEPDKRIRYKALDENLGISANTNRALEMAEGEYIALLDHDDILPADALYHVVKELQETRYEVLYSDEDKMSENKARFSDPAFKPDFNIDLLRAHNYITHLFVVKRTLALNVGGFRSEFDGAQDYDFILRCCEGFVGTVGGAAGHIRHIPRILYHWRINNRSVAADAHKKEYAREAGRKAVAAHLERMKCYAMVNHTDMWGIYKVVYETPGNPFLSIIIPGGTTASALKSCIKPLYERARYSNFEIIVVETGEENRETADFYRRMEGMRKNIRVVTKKGIDSIPERRSYGASLARGEYLLFLDCNIEIMDATAIGEMLGICMRDEVGIVAGTLYTDNDVTCHEGIVVGINGVADYLYQGIRRGDFGYLMHNRTNCDYSAVSASCMMVKTGLFAKLGGFSDKFRSELSDIDFCLRARETGALVVCAADAGWRYHGDGAPEQMPATEQEQDLFRIYWSMMIQKGDPFYNPNFVREGELFTL